MSSFLRSRAGRYWRRDVFTSFVPSPDGRTITASFNDTSGALVKAEFSSSEWTVPSHAVAAVFTSCPPGLEVVETWLEGDRFDYERHAVIGWRHDEERGVLPVALTDLPGEAPEERGVLFPDGHVENYESRWPSLDDYLKDRERQLRDAVARKLGASAAS